MQTTFDIDEDILQAAIERAQATGRTPEAVLAEVLRQGLGVEETARSLLRNGLPQIMFDTAFEASPDSILDLLDRVKNLGDLGPPLIIPKQTRLWIERMAVDQNTDIGHIAAAVVQESLLKQHIWPTRSGVPQFLRRANDRSIVTLALVNELRDAE